jgi:multidrug efflux pump subunit AcrB
LSAATSFPRSTAARSAARPRARPVPASKDRADFSGGRGQDPRGHPGASATSSSTISACRPASYNLAFGDGTTIGVNDGVILVALKEGHAPTADYVKQAAQALPAAFPGRHFYFQAADMVTQILNFGIPAQIDVRTVGRDRANNLRVAQGAARRIAAIPGIADAHLQQELDAPAFMAEIDRARASQLGLNANRSRSISTSA